MGVGSAETLVWILNVWLFVWQSKWQESQFPWLYHLSSSMETSIPWRTKNKKLNSHISHFRYFGESQHSQCSISHGYGATVEPNLMCNKLNILETQLGVDIGNKPTSSLKTLYELLKSQTTWVKYVYMPWHGCVKHVCLLGLPTVILCRN